MIQTEKFILTSSKYFQIMLRNYFRRMIWLWSILILFLLFGIFIGDIDIILFVIPLALFLLIFIVLFSWHYAYSKRNNIFFRERYYDIDEDFITGYLDEGTTSKINIKSIINLRKTKEYFLLYISKAQYFYLPFSCFKSEADLIEFEKLIKSQMSKI